MRQKSRWLAGAVIVLVVFGFLLVQRKVSPPQRPQIASDTSVSSDEPVVAQQTLNARPASSTPVSPEALETAASPKQQFDQWLDGFRGAVAEGDRNASITQGELVAEKRREWMAALIQSDPQRAIESAVPMAVRA